MESKEELFEKISEISNMKIPVSGKKTLIKEKQKKTEKQPDDYRYLVPWMIENGCSDNDRK